jgi:hypothetical protein
MFRLTCILLLLSITVNAQQAAQITGVITDHDTKEPLPGVLIGFGVEVSLRRFYSDESATIK